MNTTCHAYGDVKVKCVNRFQLTHTEIFKLESLFFTTEIFFDLPYADILEMPI